MDMIDVIFKNGYNQEGYGYKKETNTTTHWITLFSDNKIQLYSYFTEDPEGDKVYDTSVLYSITPEQLQTLIDILVENNL